MPFHSYGSLSTQADPEKPTIGATSGQNLNIYIFFSFCSNFESLGGCRMSNPRKYFPIAHLFSTLGRIWAARKPSKNGPLEERRPIGKIISISRNPSNYRVVENIFPSCIHFRLLGHASSSRNLLEFRLLEDIKPIGKIFSIARYDFD